MQFGLLANLLGASFRRPDGLSIGAIAERLGMDPTTLNRNLKPLRAPAAQRFDDELRQTDAHAVGPIRAVEHENAMGHGIHPLSCPDACPPT